MPRPRRLTLTVTALEDRWTPAAGDLDLSFGDGGVFRLTPIEEPGGVTESSAQQVVTLPDGRVVFAGNAFTRPADGSTTDFNNRLRIGRLTPNGQLDQTFDGDGFADIAGLSRPRDLLALPDGRVLVAGDASGGTFAVIQLLPDGRLDPGFGTNGVASLAVESGAGDALAVRPDGRILLAGQVGSGQGFVDGQAPSPGFRAFAVAQFTPAGQPDAGFGSGGLATVRFPAGDIDQAAAAAVAVQTDGRVLLAGSMDVAVHYNFSKATPGRLQPFFDREMAVARLNPDGSLDGSFGDGGRTRIRFGPTDFQAYEAAAVGVRLDGRVTVAGSTRGTGGNQGVSAGAVAVLTPSGRLDPAYDGDGLAVTPNPQVAFRTFSPEFVPTLQPDGGVLFLTSTEVVRLTAAGLPDESYGPGGAFARTPSGSVPISDLAVAADGGIVAAASGQVGRYRGTAPARLPAAAAGAILAGGTADGAVTLLALVDGTYQAVGGGVTYPGFGGTARTATADVTGDGTPDFVTGPGPGGGPNVVVLDGRTGARVADLDAFEESFRGGVFVAAADLTGDGRAEVVVTPDQGGGPVVVVYDGARLAAGQNEAAQLGRFFGIEDRNFRGGARPALGDVSGDGRPDVVVAAGFGGGPRVAVFDGASAADPARWEPQTVIVLGSNGRPVPEIIFQPPKLVGDFFVFEETLRNGVFVSAGDLTGDGAAEVVVGGGPGGGPRVLALDGRSLLAGRQDAVANFFAGDQASRGGVRVAVRPDAAGQPQLVTGSGDGEAATVRVYRPATARAGGTPDQTVQPFGGAALAEGVFVG